MQVEHPEGALKRASFCIRKISYFVHTLVILMCLSIFLTACDEPTKNVILVFGEGMEDVGWSGGEIEIPEREGYIFEGWYIDPEFKNSVDPYKLIESDWEGETRIYAKWREEKKKLQFENLEVADCECVYDGKAHGVEVKNVPDGANVYMSEYTDAGVYEIDVVVSKDGYQSWQGKGSLTIHKAEVDATAIPLEDKTFVFDGEEHSVELEIDDLPSGVTGYEVENNGRTEVGEQQVTFHFTVDKNHEPVDDITVTLTIIEAVYEVTFVQRSGEKTVRSVTRGCPVENIPDVEEVRGYSGRWDADLTAIYSDLEVHAVYDAIEYKISYDYGGGRIVEDTYRITDGIKELIEGEERKGYTFDGWYEDEIKIESIDCERELRDITLVGRWTLIEYTVRYVLGEGGLNDAANINFEDVYKYNVESPTKKLSAATRRGYEFVCWRDENGERVDEIVRGEAKNIVLTAEYTLLEYQIRYMDGGKILFTDTYTVEEDMPNLYVPDDKPGYKFANWRNERGDAIYELSNNFSNITLYVVWNLIIYKITYKEGNSVMHEDEYDAESELPEMYVPDSRQGYIFEGWTDEKGIATDALVKTYSDIVLYANWRAIEYKITYMDGDIKIYEDIYTVASAMPPLFMPGAKLGYNFVCWLDEENNPVDELVNTYEDIVLTAKWSIITYKIIYKDSGIIVHEDQYTVESSLLQLYTEAQKLGYEFVCWRDEKNEEVRSLSKTYSDIVLTAEWALITYTITYKDGENTLHCDTYDVEHAMPSIYEPIPKTGYTFACWKDENGEEVHALDMMYKDIVLTASWDLITYTINYMDGEALLREDTYTVESELPVLYEPQPKRGYTFDCWKDEHGEEIRKLSKTFENITLNAEWKPIIYKIKYHDGSDVTEEEYTILDCPVMLKRGSDSEDGTFVRWTDSEGKTIEMITEEDLGDIDVYSERETEKTKSEFGYEQTDGGIRIVSRDDSFGTRAVVPVEIDGQKVVDIAAGVLGAELEYLDIKAELTAVTRAMLSACTGLKELILPASVTKLDEELLAGLNKLEAVTVPFIGLEIYDADKDLNTLFAELFSSNADGEGLYPVDAFRLRKREGAQGEESIGIRYIPSSLKRVTVLQGGLPQYALAYFKSLEYVEVHGDIVGRLALRECTGLTELKLIGVTEVDELGLYQAAALQKIYITVEECRSSIDAALKRSDATDVEIVFET